MQTKTTQIDSKPLTFEEAKALLAPFKGTARALTPSEKKKMEKKLSTEKGRLEVLRQFGFY